MSDTGEWGLSRGERAPDFVAPLEGAGPARFYARAGGRPAVVIFTPRVCAATQAALEAAGDAASGHVVVPDAAEAPPLPEIDVFRDDGKLRAAFRLPEDGSPRAIVLDRNLRALEALVLDGEPAAGRLTDLLRQASGEAPAATVTAQAPVLFVPRALDPDLCEHLQQLWSASHADTGVERSAGGRRQEVLAAEAKRRRDHVVEEAELLRLLTRTLGRRLLPEVRRAFAFGADRFEGFKIACYEASSGGFFAPHRDNLSPATAHRRFALSLNLNDGYHGGELRFPEYGEALYRPAAGEALVFSSALLHEVVPLTRGRRFSLLSFLFGPQTARAATGERALNPPPSARDGHGES